MARAQAVWAAWGADGHWLRTLTRSSLPGRCAHCEAALDEADHVLHGRYDKIDLPRAAPVVTRVERYAGRCRCCAGTTLAPVPEGLEPGTPFSVGIVALAMSGEPLVRRICVSCTRSATSG